MMFIAYLLGAFALIGGIGLTVSSGWLITMASTHPPILTLGVAIVLVRFFGIFRSVARYCERVISHKAVFDGLTSLRVRIYSNLAKQNISTSPIVNSGPAVKTLVDDVERAQEYQLRIRLPGGAAVLALTAGTLLGWWVRAETLYVILPVSLVLLFIIPAAISRKFLSSSRIIEQRENEYTKNIESAVHGVVEARIYGYLEESSLPAENIEIEINQRENSLIKSSGIFSCVTNLLVGGSITGSVLLAHTLSKNMDLPSVQVAMMIFLPLVMFEAITVWYPNLFGSGKLLASQHAIDQLLKQDYSVTVKTPFETRVENIVCTDVQIAWDQQFMKPTSCEVSRGEVLVIRGKSGSGKSTFAMGLLGLLPYNGSIRIDGRELGTISNLHQIIVGTVQKSHIFNTSVRENLKIANPSATDQEIMEVLRVLDLDSLVSEMDNGLDTIIGEFGRPVSGGEAKRLAIARVLLTRAQIYIFDEPTEHLNEEISQKVMEAIGQYCRSAISIIITHSDWKNPDKTLMLVR